jgi:hypothetical protein
MGIDFALSTIFLLDVGTSDYDFFFLHFMIYVLSKSVVLLDVFCYIIVFFIFQLSLYNVLLFI